MAMPIAAPLALAYGDGQVGPLLHATIAAVAGGGVFGDHCSPLSDTSILASTGAASDHIDHVRTQLPYALVVGVLAVLAYLGVGVLVGG
ncbi:MAG: Na+/H+ antiporter NhaC family protein [Pseudomonadales bacterium]|nr:Na+/H+ antiporter NhaC family protein [Pseudomonadales bacterium]